MHLKCLQLWQKHAMMDVMGSSRSAKDRAYRCSVCSSKFSVRPKRGGARARTQPTPDPANGNRSGLPDARRRRDANGAGRRFSLEFLRSPVFLLLSAASLLGATAGYLETRDAPAAAGRDQRGRPRFVERVQVAGAGLASSME